MPYDIMSFIISCLLILAYFLHLERLTRLSPSSSIHKLNTLIREQWVDMIMSNGKLEILAIQTLRNSVMAASFMATTAVLLIVGSLNLSNQIEHWAIIWHSSFGTWHPALPADTTTVSWQIKLTLLVLVFFVAFFCFSMSIRFFNHVGYMITLPCDKTTNLTQYKQTCAYMNKAGSYYRFGTRIFFFSLPITLWFFSPCLLILATLGLIGGLKMIDKVPS